MSDQHLREDIVTVMFTDVEGFTDMTTVRGDAAAREVIEAERKIVREQIGQFDGREIDQIGDGFMVAFTSTRKAISCALAIQDSVARHNAEAADDEVRIRVGLNVGEVIEEGGHPFGAAVNGAARVAAKAKGGEVLVSEAVKQLAGTIPNVAFRDRGRFELKGFPDRWRLYAVSARSANGERSGTRARARPVVRPMWRASRRMRLVTLAGAAVLVAGVIVAILALRSGDGKPPPGGAEGGPRRSSIVLGHSIGEAELGMSEGDARNLYGEPESTRNWASRGRSGSTATFPVPQGTLEISFFDGRAVQVATRSPVFSTDGGIRVGLQVPNPGLAGSDWKDALTSGELVQTGPGEYSWRAFVYGNSYDYCSSGSGAVTMLLLAGGTARIESIRITKRAFVLDNLPLGANYALYGQPPCKHVL
jgi:class 3 adenylate cyclase